MSSESTPPNGAAPDNAAADAPGYADEKSSHVRTRLIHGIGRSTHWDYNHHVVPPISASVTFRLDSAKRGAQGFVEFAHLTPESETRTPIYIYDRLDDPTRGMLEENLAVAERGETAVCFASGMAAISGAIQMLTRSGQHIVAHRTLYGCTFSLLTNWLPRYEIQTTLVDLTHLENIAGAVRPETRIIYFETPVNPDMQLIDIVGVRRAVEVINARRPEADRIWIVVDNTFASPYCQRPLTLGADLSINSLTKSIGGFGTDLGGVVVGPKKLRDPLLMVRKDFGGTLSPKSAWSTLVYGLPSLATRMANYQKTALHLARWLERHPKVAHVHYPGLPAYPQYELAQRQMRDENGNFAPGSMIYFVLKQRSPDDNPGERLVDWIAEHGYCITLAVSLGQIKTLIECPYSMTHAAVPPEAKAADGLVPGGVRLSVGLEDWHDLTAELAAGLEEI